MKKMYTIGQVSELFDLPKSTIRYWDEQGLIRSSRQEENDYRLFDIDDIFMLYDIVFYRKLDIPIKQMKNLYGKTLTELYETLDETERRIHKELVVMKQKQKEIREQKKQLKLMIDTNEEEFPVEEIPFDCMISTEFEDIVEIKKFLPNYSSFGMMSMPASSSQTMYGFFIDPSEVHLFTQDVIWEKKDTAVYRRFLLKSEMNHAERNNILEIRERMYEKGWKTGEVIGQYLLTNTDENNIRTEYYHAWIEMKKCERRKVLKKCRKFKMSGQCYVKEDKVSSICIQTGISS
ncbi:MerR family transcriptional regulator [Enterococcus faecium]|nr:MerR family transcriptional regulator [Enterococcus faecium]